jgi:hypothetical protein
VTPAGTAGRMRPRRHEEAHHLPRGKHTPYVPINIPFLNSNIVYENSLFKRNVIKEEGIRMSKFLIITNCKTKSIKPYPS